MQVEIILYQDHAVHSECENIAGVINGDMLLQTIGAVVSESKHKIFLLSDIAVERDHEDGPLRMTKCRIDEIIKSTIISRRVIGKANFACEIKGW